MKIPKNKRGLIFIIVGLVIIIFLFIRMEDINLIQPAWFVPNVKASDMMKDVTSNNGKGLKADSKFITNTSNFSIELFKNSISKEDNSLISPISLMLPLAMTANGADGNTLAQITNALGKDIPIDTLNKYLFSLRKELKSSWKSKLHINDSIWFRDTEGLNIEKSFLQTNADYYDASIYKSAFNKQTIRDINNWVKKNTNGHIDRIINGIGSNDVMFLINTLEFDAKWNKKYEKKNINDDTFHNLDGSQTNCKFMHSNEEYYLSDDKATGFIKPYYNDHYRFVALLPKDGIQSYINNMTGEEFIKILNNASKTAVAVTIPEFHYEYSIEMSKALTSLGIIDAFSPSNADFNKLGNSSNGNIFIKEVLQKTYIYVDDHGTKAGAVTSIRMTTKSAEMGPELSVVLDRPFVYAIIDSQTNLPIFLGVVTDMSSIGK